MYLPGPGKLIMVNEEPRAAVIAHLDSPVGPLIVANTHLSFVPGWGRFQLRPGDFVKEERLPPEILAKVATKVRGVRCRECGDDDVWITSDKQLVCRNCGSTAA